MTLWSFGLGGQSLFSRPWTIFPNVKGSVNVICCSESLWNSSRILLDILLHVSMCYFRLALISHFKFCFCTWEIRLKVFQWTEYPERKKERIKCRILRAERSCFTLETLQDHPLAYDFLRTDSAFVLFGNSVLGSAIIQLSLETTELRLNHCFIFLKILILLFF
jgi:hypothetical protein